MAFKGVERRLAAITRVPLARRGRTPGPSLCKWRSLLVSTVAAAGILLHSVAVPAADRPNIVVILTDDQGYADISLNPHHPQEVSTPHIDALAREGVFFTNAYTSGPLCLPTRAGLMLGRYQQRVGVYSVESRPGFDPTLPIFPSFLPQDYASTAIGKWHLGLDQDYPKLEWHPLSRGFDECYAFMGSTHLIASRHDYFDLRSNRHPIYRNRSRIRDTGYLTDRLSEEAVAFIDRNKQRPFFLYLAYNAVHSPPQAPTALVGFYRKAFPELGKRRGVLMAMLKHLDDGVGKVVAKLKQEGLFDNTLLFFLTDNGGAKLMEADNSPLRGFKGSLLEGGVRVPFIVSWPERFQGSRSLDTPVVSIDILPTAIEATGGEMPVEPPMDGRSLLAQLTGSASTHHETLYWDAGPEVDEWAVRQGRWKLRSLRGRRELFDLAVDPSEARDLISENRALAQQLSHRHSAWLDEVTTSYLSSQLAARERRAERARKRAERKKARRDKRKSQ